jgi:hypothetical protein
MRKLQLRVSVCEDLLVPEFAQPKEFARGEQ